ncbi:nucleotidyltransferase [Betaproteobacteria bacterium]|nr:nucleotidyltransferase [Betaproteobacteria bacterium]GHU45508.1 nucleotidyltransferase [Betaproteobacteria bacterium]
MIDYTKLQKSIAHLSAQFHNWQTLDETLPPLLQEAVAESVIQRFEVCYDCTWKVLKRYLAKELGVPDMPNSPKPIFRIAHENLVFNNVDEWLVYADLRIDVAHDYSGEKAQVALRVMGQFVEAVSALYGAMNPE